MSQMNGYEIRTKILKMAKEQVNEEYYQKNDRWLNDGGKQTPDDICPTPPSLKDILSVAKEMYRFVETQTMP